VNETFTALVLLAQHAVERSAWHFEKARVFDQSLAREFLNARGEFKIFSPMFFGPRSSHSVGADVEALKRTPSAALHFWGCGVATATAQPSDHAARRQRSKPHSGRPFSRLAKPSLDGGEDVGRAQARAAYEPVSRHTLAS
jgi:hypothetical protein